ncbi:MAG: TolC family protein [candidate division Zixibacteria bacterium]|nr:TolC family protein [candidate division Zixibacteria bacterium]
MKSVACVLTLLFCLSIVGSVAATEVLTLDDCIEVALQKRSSIIVARGNESLAGANKRAALGAFLPRLEASYNYSEGKTTDIKPDATVLDSMVPYVDTIEINGVVYEGVGVRPYYHTEAAADQNRSNKSLSFSANMTLFNLSNWFNLAGSKADYARARLDVLGSEQDLIKAVKVSYYYYLAAVENIAVQKEAVARSEEQLKLINSKYELGSASLSDVLKQKVQFGNDRLALLAALNAVTSGRASLAYTVGLDPNGEYEFSTEFARREYTGTLEEAMAFGLDHKPSLLAARKSVDASRYAVRSRYSEYLPTLGGWASISFADGTQGDTATYNFSSRSSTIGFQVRWNIFDGFNRERNLTSARIGLNNSRARLADTRNLTAERIKTAYLDIERLKEKKKVSQETVDAATEDHKITQEKYNLGAATILDLLDSQVSLRQAQVSLIQADFNLNLAIAELENAMGKM